MRWIIVAICFLVTTPTLCQITTADSSRMLPEITVEAYELDRALTEVAGSVNVVDVEDFERFSNTSILPAVNVLPGVRMEERSPGSYRFSIRGSSLRSPFGVRNVKAYWNGLPFTDGGGNTYLNLLDFNAIESMEIIKGPGGSLYGAGTGGVLLMRSPRIINDQLEVTATAGSYGLQRYLLSGQLANDNFGINAQLSHQRSTGYREQSALKRNAFNADVRTDVGKRGNLLVTMLVSNLFYETPGGLTLDQYLAGPDQARPPSAVLGAVEARAAVRNTTFYGGMVHESQWGSRWATTFGIYAGSSAFKNPTIRNYEVRDERNAGLRATVIYELGDDDSIYENKITFGGEFQHFDSPISVYDNDGDGNPGPLQVSDEVGSRVGLFFIQGDFQIKGGVFVTGGLSVNQLRYDFLRLDPAPAMEQIRNFDPVVSPRLALLKKVTEHISVHASYSDGFSPPSLAEVRPSTNTFSNSLKAERGNNLEIGTKGMLPGNMVSFDVVAYDFRLKNTIVVRRNAEGADYFENAGKTSQRGVEAFIAVQEPTTSRWKIWASYARQRYRFIDYVSPDADLSGNKLTGVAPTTFSGGVDVDPFKSVQLHATVNYVDHIPLNDANTAFAEEYFLIGLRADWTRKLSSSTIELFAGVDNLLNKTYSLGNDLNAFGGRYYNAAMPRNYYAGITMRLSGNE